MFSNSLPVIASSSFSSIPNCFAIAVAVILWSPVIITVFIPADLHFSTAFFASSLGGSIIPTIPTKIKSDSSFSISSFDSGNFFIFLYPNANTLKAFLAILSLFSYILFLNSSKSFSIFPFIIYEVQFLSNSSTPPLVYTIYSLSILWTVVINFLDESNGISFNLSILNILSISISKFIPISTNAVSVGSPANSLLAPTFVSLHNIALYIKLSKSDFDSTNLIFSISISLLSTYIFWTVILFWVNVPVLSEHITDALPKVSTAGNLFTIAFFLTILCTPIAKTIVDTAANPSGIAATAKLTAVMNMWIGSFPYNKPIMNITTQIANAAIPNIFPNLFNFSCSGVVPSSLEFIISAIFPTSVFIPVSTTIPFPLP